MNIVLTAKGTAVCKSSKDAKLKWLAQAIARLDHMNVNRMEQFGLRFEPVLQVFTKGVTVVLENLKCATGDFIVHVLHTLKQVRRPDEF